MNINASRIRNARAALLFLVNAMFVINCSRGQSAQPPPAHLASNAVPEVVIATTNSGGFINLGTFVVSTTMTNWFRLGTNEVCAVTGQSITQFPGRVAVQFTTLTTNFDRGASGLRVKTDILETTLSSDELNVVAVDGMLLTLTPKLPASRTN